jgi:signal transduction histidine kinase
MPDRKPMETSITAAPRAAPGQPVEPSKKIRITLFLAFAGLLALFFAAGAYSYKTLCDLHTIEQQVRHRMTARTQAVVRFTRSIEVYDSDVDSFLLSEPSEASVPASSLFVTDVATIESEERDYPSGQSQMIALLDQMDRDLSGENRVLATALAWSLADRRQLGPALLRDQIAPRRVAVLQVLQQVSTLNDQQLADDDRQLLATFRNGRIRIGWTLAAILIFAVALSLATTLYILRLQLLERQRYDELVQRRRQLQDLSARLVDVQEEERRAMSRELHDEVGQSLEALLVESGTLSRLVPHENSAAQQQITRIRSIVEGLVNIVRNIALLLRPSMLDDLGLAPALEWQAREISRRSEMEVEVCADNISDQLDDRHKICIYRLAQEALNNAARHASATTATVRVEQTAEKITIAISDNGKSFDAQSVRGMGLIGMEERVRHLGGTLIVDSRPGAGTTVRAELPLDAAPLSQSA